MQMNEKFLQKHLIYLSLSNFSLIFSFAFLLKVIARIEDW